MTRVRAVITAFNIGIVLPGQPTSGGLTEKEPRETVPAGAGILETPNNNIKERREISKVNISQKLPRKDGHKEGLFAEARMRKAVHPSAAPHNDPFLPASFLAFVTRLLTRGQTRGNTAHELIPPNLF